MSALTALPSCCTWQRSFRLRATGTRWTCGNALVSTSTCPGSTRPCAGTARGSSGCRCVSWQLRWCVTNSLLFGDGLISCVVVFLYLSLFAPLLLAHTDCDSPNPGWGDAQGEDRLSLGRSERVTPGFWSKVPAGPALHCWRPPLPGRPGGHRGDHAGL